jgi:hypothetical protein
VNCPQDCATDCGNQQCDSDETIYSCSADCYCGNGTCDPGEDPSSCAQDCVTAQCGNGTCESAAGETEDNCPQDCISTSCGDGTCDPDEDATSCPDDCGNGCVHDTCDLYPQCGCQSGQKCTLDPAAERACLTAGSTSAGGHCTAETDCAVGTICLPLSDTEGQCLSYCDPATGCSGGAGSYCVELQSNGTPIPGALVCTIDCNPADPSLACGSGFGCEIYEDSTTQDLFTDCHGNVGAAQEGEPCDNTAEQYCAPELLCNSNDGLCYRWCVNNSDCIGGGSCDTAAFTNPLIIGSTQYGVCR